MATIELQQVGKHWGDIVAVEPTDLIIDDGEFVAILGPSGCGKSTTLLMLAGIYAPSSGEIRFDNAVVNEVEARDRNVGIVFQSYALYPHLSVRDNIIFPLKFKRLTKSEARRRAEEAAAMVHVTELLQRKPGQLSGGQQQRVALARALVKQPQLLLLDEPLSNLDATLRLSMRSEIKRLQRRLGVTTVLVTHDQIEATTMADRIICMSKGRIEQVGSPDDLYRRPASLFVARFVGAPPINILQGHGNGDVIAVNGVELPLTGNVNDAVSLGIRPENLKFGEKGIAARIEQIEPMGRETLYLLDTPLGVLHLLESGGARLAPGDNVRVSWRDADTLVFDNASSLRIADAGVALPQARG